jgi:hypothetical protein
MHISTLEFYSAIKKKEITSLAGKWIELEITSSEKRHTHHGAIKKFKTKVPWQTKSGLQCSKTAIENIQAFKRMIL